MNEQGRTAVKKAKPWHKAFLVALAKAGNYSEACRNAKVGRTIVWQDRRDDPDFAAACSDAMEEYADGLEEEARKRSTTGKSDTLLIFLLKAARPEKYRDRSETKHTGGTTLQIIHEIVDVPDAASPPAPSAT
jgi:hypothetical protein